MTWRHRQSRWIRGWPRWKGKEEDTKLHAADAGMRYSQFAGASLCKGGDTGKADAEALAVQ